MLEILCAHIMTPPAILSNKQFLFFFFFFFFFFFLFLSQTPKKMPNTHHHSQTQNKGIANVESVLTWIENQQKMGGLATTFDDFVVMGDSAGAIATQVWSSALLERFSYKKAAIIPDSYIGNFSFSCLTI